MKSPCTTFATSGVAALALLALATTLACESVSAQPTSQPATKRAPKPTTPTIERGLYLVNTGGCHDCHTPFKMGEKGPEPDMGRMLSGHPAALQMPPVPKLPEGPWLTVSSATNTAFAGPWGVSFSANLTPHAETGMGRWSERDFVQTIRSGRHLGVGRPVLPPMPTAVYQHFTDSDLKAIYAYLRTVPALNNPVPEPWAPRATK